LLKCIVEHYRGQDRPARHPGPAQNSNAFLSHPAALAWKLASLPSLIQVLRRSSRPPCRNANDRNIGFALFTLNPENLRRLLEAATAWKITVNDLLLALLTKGCAMLAPARLRTGRRKNISVGCIVNTRRDLGIESQTAFGLALGSFVVSHPAPEESALPELAKAIGGQTLQIKRKRLYLATPLELSMGRFMFRFFSTERRKKLYQKHYPLWGGVTNMNINSLWQQTDGTEPLDYLRAVSTGPITPLVLSFTTAGSGANIGLSYRSTVYSPEDIERFKHWFLEALAELEVRG